MTGLAKRIKRFYGLFLRNRYLNFIKPDREICQAFVHCIIKLKYQLQKEQKEILQRQLEIAWQHQTEAYSKVLNYQNSLPHYDIFKIIESSEFKDLEETVGVVMSLKNKLLNV